MASSSQYSHPDIGTFVASTAQEGVTQFLGVQYATLEHRFAPPIIKKYQAGTLIDASKFGPTAFTVPNHADFEFGLLQQTLDYDRDAVTMSDTECLNLNITLPFLAGEPPEGAELPVMAFIHGGGFNGGSNRLPQYDMARLVRLSAAEGQPMIAVVLNYRLGAPGFMHSLEMERAGCKPNNGIRDQRVAFSWLRQYIAGFGGDPENITCLGESAGAKSVALHLFSKEPLFKRAVMMSGSSLLQPLQSAEELGANYDRAVAVLELTDMKEEERMRHLIEMDGQGLRSRLFAAGIGRKLMVDGDTISSFVDYKSFVDRSLEIPGRQWCDSIVIGDCQFDGSIIGLGLMNRKSGIASRFCTAVESSLSSSVASSLLSGYGLDPSTPDDEALTKVLEYSNDLLFYTPTILHARILSPHIPVYVYRFNEPNTWPGTWQGRTTHIHDLSYLLQNFNEKLEESQQNLAAEFGKDFIKFVNGKEPWKKYEGEDGVAKVIKVGETGVRSDVPEEVERRGVMLDLAKWIGFEALADAFGRFMAG